MTSNVTNAFPTSTILNLGEATGNTIGTFDLDGNSQTLAGLQTLGTGTSVVTSSARAAR